MSLNVGGIYVAATRSDLSQDRVVSEIRRYWLGRGAEEDTRNPLELEPLSLEKTGRLGYAVLPVRQGWIPVYDSERYQADCDLARHLSETLETETWWYQLAELTDAAFIRRYGAPGGELPSGFEAVVEKISGFPSAFIYYNKLCQDVDAETLASIRLIGFRNIRRKEDAYYRGATPEHIARSDHFDDARDAARSGEVPRLFELLDSRPELAAEVAREVIGRLDPEDRLQRRTMLAIAQRSSSNQELRRPGYLVRYFKAALLEGDDDVMRLVDEQVTPRSQKLGEELSILGYYTMIDNRYEAAQKAFELALRVERLPLEAYCNALYVLLPSNSGMPVAPARARRFLQACLPHGPSNPAIFRNAACLHAAMGDWDEALKQIRLARAHGYPKMTEMLKDDELEPLFDNPAFLELVTGKRSVQTGTAQAAARRKKRPATRAGKAGKKPARKTARKTKKNKRTKQAKKTSRKKPGKRAKKTTGKQKKK